MKKAKLASIRPSPLASAAGIVGGVVMAGIGLAFMASAPADTGGEGLVKVFFLFWFLVCGAIIAYNVRNFTSYSRQARQDLPLTASDVVELEPDEAEAMDFAARLRKLEGLRRDGLIDETEFQKKRREIMDEKW